MEDSQGKGLKVATFFRARRIRDNSVFVKRSGMYFWMFFFVTFVLSGNLASCRVALKFSDFFWAE